MNQIELAYFAGFFDGEGSIGIAKHKSKSCIRGYFHELFIQVSNSNHSVILKFKQYFGGSIIPFKAPKKLQMWRWTISTRKAFKFLKKILPFLIVKKTQADLGIEFQLKKKHRSSLNDSEFADEQLIRKKIMILNRKGKCTKYPGELIQEFPK